MRNHSGARPSPQARPIIESTLTKLFTLQTITIHCFNSYNYWSKSCILLGMFVQKHHFFKTKFDDAREETFCADILSKRSRYLITFNYFSSLIMAGLAPLAFHLAQAPSDITEIINVTHLAMFASLLLLGLVYRNNAAKLAMGTFLVNIFCFLSIAAAVNLSHSSDIRLFATVFLAFQSAGFLLMLPFPGILLDMTAVYIFSIGVFAFWDFTHSTIIIAGFTGLVIITSSINRLAFMEQRQQLIMKFRQLKSSEKMFIHDMRSALQLSKDVVGLAAKNDYESIAKEASDILNDIDFMEAAIQNEIQTHNSERTAPLVAIDIGEIINGSVSRSKRIVPRLDQRIEINLNHREQVLGNRIMLARMLINLITNALQINGENGLIRISTADDTGPDGNHNVTVRIFNDKSYIEPNHIQTLFSLGFSKRENGSGVGLALVKDVIESHTGQIQVTSSVSSGTEFKVMLPSVKSLQLAPNEPIIIINERRRYPWKHIFLVEDSAFARQNWIDKNPTLFFKSFASPEELLDTVVASDLENSLIITDFHFKNSQMNGLELAETLKKQPNVTIGMSSWYEMLPEELIGRIDFVLDKDKHSIPRQRVS